MHPGLPPGPVSCPPQASPLRFLSGLVAEHGDAVRYGTPFGPVCFFNHPDQVQQVLQSALCVRTSLVTPMLGQGLLASDGDWWRRQRKLVQPPFHERCLAGFAPLVTDAALKARRRWEERPAGEPIDLAAEMRTLALDVIFRAVLSQELGEEAREICAAVTGAIEDLGAVAGAFFHVPVAISPTRNEDFLHARRTVDRFVHGLMARRRASPEPPRDLLSLLLGSRDAQSGEPAGEEAVRDEVVTMIIAGHETAAITLGWAWLLLAGHPAVEERLQAELEAALGGRAPSLEDLPRLPYTRMILQETMRLYPPVWSMMRRTEGECELGGHRLPARSLVLVCPWTTHRHPAFWAEPERFEPERFAGAEPPGGHRFAWLPFSGGRHHCLGQGFAMMEMPLLLATLAQGFRLRFPAGRTWEPLASLTLRPPADFQAFPEPRC